MTLADTADQLLALTTEPAIWLGWSLGGLLAMTAASRQPHHVRKLVLVGATPRFTQATDWECAMPTATLTQFANDLAGNYRQTLARFLSLQLGEGEQARALLRDLRQRMLHPQPPAPVALQAGLEWLRDTDLRSVLPGLTQSTRVIHGGKDRLVSPGAGRYLAAHLPDARLTLIDQAGHIPFLTHADAFLASVRTFCDE